MNEKKSLLILFGGPSSEHEVSRISAASVIRHTDRDRYDMRTVGITMDGSWILTEASPEDIESGRWEEAPGNRRAVLLHGSGSPGLFTEKDEETFSGKIPVDVVFPVLHGRYGEDGTVQGVLEAAGVPYVGSGVASSAASMDKASAKAVVEKAGAARQADCLVLHSGIGSEEEKEQEVDGYFSGRYPLFVKPANAGSSVGISKVKRAGDLREAMAKAFREDEKILVEEGITGRELEVAVLGNEKPSASCIGEIFAANEFYDYNAKYENSMSETAIVEDLDCDGEREIRETALRVYKALGRRGLARVDFFLEEDGTLVFNEINTMPGFTKISMYPKLWEASGIPYSRLIDRLILLALR